MANMLNRAYAVQKRAREVLLESEPYVSGVVAGGKKLLYVLVESLESAARELESVINECSNLLPEYEDTPDKKEMEDLLYQLQERINLIRAKAVRP